MQRNTRKCELLNFPKIKDDRGNLSFLEAGKQLPFDLARAYWIYDVPGGEQHGGHAFRSQDECIIALSGSFDVRIRTAQGEERHSLNRSYHGLYVPAGNWRSLENFSTNALGLVLSSGSYDPKEYIRDFEQVQTLYAASEREILSRSASLKRDISSRSAADKPLQDKPQYSVRDCRLVELPTHHDREGNLTAVNGMLEVPFDLKRIYYVYDIPYGSQRGGHAHKQLKQWIIAAGSCFDVLLDDGREQQRFRLDRPNLALEIQAGIWREISNFASGAVVLVLASELFSEADYLRDYKQFLAFRTCK